MTMYQSCSQSVYPCRRLIIIQQQRHIQVIICSLPTRFSTFYKSRPLPRATLLFYRLRSHHRESPQPREDTSVQEFQKCALDTARTKKFIDTWLLNYIRTPSTDSVESKLRSRLVPTKSTIRVKLEVITEVSPKIRSSGM